MNVNGFGSCLQEIRSSFFGFLDGSRCKNDFDQTGRLLVSPLHRRTTKFIVLDKDPDRQIGDSKKWIDRSEVYETKHISNMRSLSRYDKEKIKMILRKK